MEEYDKYISFMEVDLTGNCKPLQLISNRNISETNDSFPYSLGNEPRNLVEKHEIKIEEQQNTVSSDFEDDSEIRIYDQTAQIEKTLSTATKNTNLFIRKTKKDHLDPKTYFNPKNNPSSNTVVKSNQIKIPSTSAVNMPKTTTSEHLQPKSSTNTEIGHNSEIRIYDQTAQTEKTLSTATKNTNLFIRKTKKDHLDPKTYFNPKNNPSSNTVVKSNQIKIPSTSAVNVSKTTTSEHLQPKSSTNTEIGHNSEIRIYDQTAQTEKTLSTATKNTNLFIRKTKKDHLDPKTYFNPKNNPSSNPMVKSNQIKIPSTSAVNMPKTTTSEHLQPKSSTNTEIGHNSEIRIYDQTAQTEKTLSTATKNTNLFIRKTKKDHLDPKTYFNPKNNPSSNPVVKSNQIKIPSTSAVNMPKTTTSEHLQPKSSTNTEIGHNSEIRIYDQTAQTEKTLSTATKNTNLFISKTKKDHLDPKTYFNPKNNPSSNPVVKSNQIKIPSTSAVNMPKTTTSEHLQPKSSTNTEIGHNSEIRIFDQMAQTEKTLFTATKNTNLFIRKTKKDHLDPKTYFNPKNNPSSNPVVKSNQIKIPSTSAVNMPKTTTSEHLQPKSSTNTEIGHNSEIRIYDQTAQTEKTLSTATKNTNLFISKTKKDHLDPKTYFNPKNNPSSNPVVKSNQIKIPSTSAVNMPKTTTSEHLQPKSSTNTEIGHNKSFLKPNQYYSMFRINDFSNVSRIKKYIPHTVSSKDLMEDNSNTIVQKDKVQINTNCLQKLNASSSQLSSNSEYLKQLDSSSLSYGRVQEVEHGKITKNDNATIQLSQLDSFTKSKAKLNTYKVVKNDANDLNGSEDDKIKNLNIRGTVNENLNSHKVSLSEETINLKSKSYDEYDLSDKFFSCKYIYCDIIVSELEMVDNLYCSFDCQKMDLKEILTKDKNVNAKSTSLLIKSAVDIKYCSKISEKRISEKKQVLTTYRSEKMDKVNDDCDEHLNHVFNKPSIEKYQSLLKPLMLTISPESINDDNDDEHFDLKTFIEDKDVLEYMQQFQINSAPKKLFDTPFPTEKNCFLVGQKLEAIDPKNVALFCVMTVSEVCGYRIKLHFDGYQDDYDFWVNADCPDLFYPGWCASNSRILQPPKDYGEEFNWIEYLGVCQAVPAPKHNFVSTKHNNSCKNHHKFHIGGKLEALDKFTRVLLKQLICVATVADILGNRIRIHLDGWTDDFDYWVDISSTNIHPICWCDNNGKMLMPPKGYKNGNKRKMFDWAEYLKETNSKPIPEDAFVRRPLRDFSNTMIIEVVDSVIPRQLRIARVVDVRNNELKIIYDGFDKKYEYWVEDDNPDIHPVGWSLQTNHPIEMPPALYSNCLIPGCKGYVNSSNSVKNYHRNIKDCPYEINSWRIAISGFGRMPNRLKNQNVLTTSTLESSKTKINVHHDTKKENNIEEKKKKKRLNFLSDANNIEPKCDTAIENSLFNDNIPFINKNKLCNNIGLSLVGFNLNSESMDPLARYWTEHYAQLGVPIFNTTDARTWSIHEVASYVQKVVTSNKSDSQNTNEDVRISDRFIDQEIDGEAFLMLNQDDLMEILKIPLGLAIQIFYAIKMLRQRTSDYDILKT